jgi:hypothetical protein
MTTMTVTGIDALTTDLIEIVKPYFNVKTNHLRQAVAAACGFRNEAAFNARVAKDSGWETRSFDHAAFVSRLTGLTENAGTAEAVGVLLQGVSLDLSFAIRQSVLHSSEVTFDMSVAVTGATPEVLESAGPFYLPQFFNHQRELYRVDSAAWHRVDPYPFEVTRSGMAHRGLLTAELHQGAWEGGAYIYDTAHRIDPRGWQKNVMAAMAREILPTLNAGVRCQIFRPDRYQHGAWRVELTIGPEARRYMGPEFGFSLPRLPKRLWVCADGYGSPSTLARMLEGRWQGDLYTNGVAEGDNPVPIVHVHRAIVDALVTRLAEAGWKLLQLPSLVQGAAT